MKYILIAIIAAFTFSSCSNNENEKPENGRIKFIERDNSKTSFLYEIIEVDGVEYIASSRGGIYPLVKQNSDKTVFKENVGSIEYNTIDLP